MATAPAPLRGDPANDRISTLEAIGMPWFSADDYDAFRKLLPARRWHARFGTWQEGAEKLRQQTESDLNVPVLRVPVRSNEFAAWCRDHGRAVDYASLREYTTALVRQDRAPRTPATPEARRPTP